MLTVKRDSPINKGDLQHHFHQLRFSALPTVQLILCVKVIKCLLFSYFLLRSHREGAIGGSPTMTRGLHLQPYNTLIGNRKTIEPTSGQKTSC